MQSEHKDLLLLLIITGIIAICGFFIFTLAQSLFIPDLMAGSYDASFSWDGTLQESYQYKVSTDSQYRSLNRKFDSSVYLDEHSGPYVRFISIQPPDGTVGYLKDANGHVTLQGGDAYTLSIISDRAGRNEAGAYNPEYYQSGTYQVSYTWDLIPWVERGSDSDHLNHLNLLNNK